MRERERKTEGERAIHLNIRKTLLSSIIFYRVFKMKIPDLSYFAPDCFHFSQKLHALGKLEYATRTPMERPLWSKLPTIEEIE